MADDFPRYFRAYLLDGFRVYLFPVTTFSQAADRELPIARVVSLLLALMLVLLVLQLPSLVPLTGYGFAAFAMLYLATWLLESLAFLAAGGLLFLVTRLFGGSATARRFFSAFLVFVGAHIAILFVAFIVVIAAVLSMSAEAIALLPPLAAFGLMAVFLVMASYTVLVARFGGGLGFPAAFGATVVFLALVFGIYVAVSLYILGEPAMLPGAVPLFGGPR